MEQRPQTTWVCVPRTITEQVPVVTRVAAPPPCPDGSPGFYGAGFGAFNGRAAAYGAADQCVSYQTVCRTVMERVPQTTMVNCPVTRCVPVQMQGTRTVCRRVPQTVNQECVVTKCVPVVRKGTRPVTECVTEMVQREVPVVECVRVFK